MRVTIRKIKQISADKKHKFAYEVRINGQTKDKFWRKADADNLAKLLRKRYKGYK